MTLHTIASLRARQQTLFAAVLAAVWVLALVLAWLLLPLVLRPEGALLVIWYAAGWVGAVLVGVVPFVVGSTLGSDR